MPGSAAATTTRFEPARGLTAARSSAPPTATGPSSKASRAVVSERRSAPVSTPLIGTRIAARAAPTARASVRAVELSTSGLRSSASLDSAGRTNKT
jgi:hypothetical protein